MDMIWLIVYLIGVVIAFVSLVRMEREDKNITLVEVPLLCVASCFSWIIVFDLLIVNILLYLGKDDVIVFKKKERKKHG